VVRDSSPYLIGDMYWNQLIHEGMFLEFANCPPNSIIGIMITPDRDTAISSFLKILEIKYPKEAAA